MLVWCSFAAARASRLEAAQVLRVVQAVGGQHLDGHVPGPARAAGPRRPSPCRRGPPRAGSGNPRAAARVRLHPRSWPDVVDPSCRPRPWPSPLAPGRAAFPGFHPPARGSAGRTPRPRDAFLAGRLRRIRQRCARTGPRQKDCCGSSPDLPLFWHGQETVPQLGGFAKSVPIFFHHFFLEVMIGLTLFSLKMFSKGRTRSCG
jgi:hypothetical protein